MLPRPNIKPASTSYFTAPASELDPDLFPGGEDQPISYGIRSALLSSVYTATEQKFHNPEAWLTTWAAGSGVSYLWRAARTPGDLDILLGVNYIGFRQANPNYAGLSDHEISATLNELWRSTLQPEMANWMGRWEVTFYSNPGATDIRDINPYAAYNLTKDEWSVHPQRTPASHSIEGDRQAAIDLANAHRAINRYGHAVTTIRDNRASVIQRSNAQLDLQAALDQASAMFDEIHAGRHIAFGPTGLGFLDPANYRWQAGKASGAIQALKSLKDYRDSDRNQQNIDTYGVELPDSDVLIRRAAIYRAER